MKYGDSEAKPGDSCVNHFLSITHEIYKSCGDRFDARSVFLDISKAFDKVWHERIIFKLKQNGTSWRAFKFIMTLFKEQRTESSFKRASFDVN